MIQQHTLALYSEVSHDPDVAHTLAAVMVMMGSLQLVKVGILQAELVECIIDRPSATEVTI